MGNATGTAVGDPGARWFPVVLVVAFLLKALLLFVVIPVTSNLFSGRYEIGFADGYDALADNIVTGVGYRVNADMADTMMREPGYPLFLSGVFKVLGYHIESARLANLLLALVTVLLLARVAQRLSDDQAVPVVATPLFLFHPGVMISEARGGVEMLFIFALVVFILALSRAVTKARHRDYFVAGVALGFVLLVRSTLLLFPIVVLGYLIYAGRNIGERVGCISNVVFLVLGAALVISPWVIRNYLLVNEFVLTASVQAVAAQEGQYTCEHMSLERDFQDVQDAAAEERNEVARALGIPFRGPYYQLFYTPRHELLFNSALRKVVLDKYRENPRLFGKCVAQNLIKFWILGKTWTVTWFNVLVQLPLVILATIGAWLVWKRGPSRTAALVILLMIYIIAVHAVNIAHSRHSLPLVPFLAIFASIALIGVWRARCRKKLRREQS